jgi:hypothetical protein
LTPRRDRSINATKECRQEHRQLRRESAILAIRAVAGPIAAAETGVVPLDVEIAEMFTYFFDVTVKVTHHDVPIKVVLYKGARASDELTARREILNRLLEGRFQVVRIDRVRERCVRTDAD